MALSVTRNFLSSIEEWTSSRPLSVMGATGSGKTSLVLDYLKQNPEKISKTLLVSVDAVALFKELDIGSAKPLGKDRSDFQWTGLDLFSPSEKVTLTDYVNAVAPKINDALKKNHFIILVGGSHFYERALVLGQSPGSESDPVFQKSLEGYENSLLLERLLRLDSRWSKKAHLNDRYRLCRYLDLAERQGLEFDVLFAPPKRHELLSPLNHTVDCLTLGLDVNIEDFRVGLEARVRQMFSAGWVEEVKSLLQKYPPESPGLESVGYREITEYINGRIPLEACIELIVTAHAQLAKKQRTWLRSLMKF